MNITFKITLVCLLAISTFYGSAGSVVAKEKETKNEEVKTEQIEEVQEMPDLDIQSDKAILYDMNLKKVIYEKNADVQAPTASLAKVMNMYLASEALKEGEVKKEDMVTISTKAWKSQGSRMFIEVGKQIPFWELFKGMSIVSGNDASVAIAEHLSGSTDDYVLKMNEKAKALGMTNTKYVTVNGYPLNGSENDLSTPRDLAVLSESYLTKFKENLEVHKTKVFSFDNGRNVIEQTNKNTLLGHFAGTDGLKTGWVDGHYNIITTAERDNIRLIAVVMTAPSEKVRAQDASKLLDYGFKQYSKYVLNGAGELVDKLPVYKSKEIKRTDVVIKDELEIVLHSSQVANLKEEMDIPDYVTGGKKKDDVVGEKYVYLGEKKIGEVPIVLSEDIPKGGIIHNLFDSVALGFKWTTTKLGNLF